MNKNNKQLYGHWGFLVDNSQDINLIDLFPQTFTSNDGNTETTFLYY